MTGIPTNVPHLVGLNSAGNLWSSASGSWQEMKIPSQLNQVSYSNSTICGVDSKNQIWCNNPANPTNFTVPQGSLKNISIYGNKAVGYNSQNQIYYTDNIMTSNPNWSQLKGDIQGISMSANRVCYLNNNNQVYCNDTPNSKNFQKVHGGPFTNFSTYNNQMTALNQEGLLGTQEIQSRPQWKNICQYNSKTNPCPGKAPLTYAAMYNNGACVIDSQNNIFCQDTTGAWKQTSGALKNMYMDNYSAESVPVGAWKQTSGALKNMYMDNYSAESVPVSSGSSPGTLRGVPTMGTPQSLASSNRKTCSQEYGNSGYGWVGWDANNGGGCWACPSTFPNRTLNAVASSTACGAGFANAGGTSSAKYLRPGLGLDGLTSCPAGSFADPNGNCYQNCPANTNRTIYPVTSPQACQGPCSSLYPGSFLDLSTGNCYACPSGFNRSTAPISASNACVSP